MGLVFYSYHRKPFYPDAPRRPAKKKKNSKNGRLLFPPPEMGGLGLDGPLSRVWFGVYTRYTSPSSPTLPVLARLINSGNLADLAASTYYGHWQAKLVGNPLFIVLYQFLDTLVRTSTQVQLRAYFSHSHYKRIGIYCQGPPTRWHVCTPYIRYRRSGMTRQGQ